MRDQSGKPYDSIQCICPEVTILTNRGQVSETDIRQVADRLHAMVRVMFRTGEHGGVVFGAHRQDCPCR